MEQQSPTSSSHGQPEEPTPPIVVVSTAHNPPLSDQESLPDPPRVVFKPASIPAVRSSIKSSEELPSLSKHKPTNRSVEFHLSDPDVSHSIEPHPQSTSRSSVRIHTMHRSRSASVKSDKAHTTSQTHTSLQDDSLERIEFDGDLDSLLVLTRGVPLPTFFETIREVRSILRLFQCFSAIAAFVSLGFATFATGFPSWVQMDSGINIMCFVSISSLIVSSSCIFLYLNPRMLGIPPQRHPRFSWVEVALDFIYAMMWILASSRMAWFSRCPRTIVMNTTISPPSFLTNCVDWIVSYSFGYVCVILFSITFCMGMYDLLVLKGHTSSHHGPSSRIMFARGTWKSTS